MIKRFKTLFTLGCVFGTIILTCILPSLAILSFALAAILLIAKDAKD